MKFQEHHPPHIYKPKTIYFITSKTVNGIKIFNTEEKLQLLISVMQISAKRYNIILYGWVILSNHNHLLIYVNSKKEMLLFIKSLHGKSAIEINKIDSTYGRKIWYQYWDRCIRSERDFWLRLNYIHHNPVKHGYTKDMFTYRFSSIGEYLQHHGKDWLIPCFKEYPIVDFTPERGLE